MSVEIRLTALQERVLREAHAKLQIALAAVQEANEALRRETRAILASEYETPDDTDVSLERRDGQLVLVVPDNSPAIERAGARAGVGRTRS